MLSLSRHGRRPMRWLATMVPLVAVLLVVVPASAKTTHPCSSITKCRAAATWHHSVASSLNERIAIAYQRAPGGRPVPKCHTLASCRFVAAKQAHNAAWAAGAWQHVQDDNTVAGLYHAINYIFHSCGPTAVAEGKLITKWESGPARYNTNAAGDTSWWQIERPVHPDVSLDMAQDAWESTGWAKRASSCGTNWSPTWSSVRDHGMGWD